LLSNNPPVVYGDGGQTRDFAYVANVAHGNLLAADSKDAAGQIFNIANGKTTSLLELISALNELLGTDVTPKFEPARAGDVRDSMADISRAQKTLGYLPPVDFQTGLAKSIEYYKSIVNV